MSDFAKDYPRDSHNWIEFPRDIQWRKKLFPQSVFDHPAKAQMFLIQELYRYLTHPGDTIVDPFAGTGTIMIALLEGRNVALIDIEPHYIDIIKETQELWIQRDINFTARLTVMQGDNRQKLQELDFLCDAVIFSPPYANTLSSGGETRTRDSDRITPDAIQSYGGKQTSTQNLGRLNPFLFERQMTRVYQRLHSRLVKGAPMAIISKDNMQAGRRMLLSERIIRQVCKSGFELSEWHKWKMPLSSYRAPAEAKGLKTVSDEDILIFRRQP